MRSSTPSNAVNLWWQAFLLPPKNPEPIEVKKPLMDKLLMTINKEIPKKPMVKKQIIKKDPPKSEAKLLHKHVRYYLGEKYPGIYITGRELMCLRLYAKNHTISECAKKMGICYRAGESLIVGMRKRCGDCQRAADLLKHPGLIKLLQNKKPIARKRENDKSPTTKE